MDRGNSAGGEDYLALTPVLAGSVCQSQCTTQSSFARRFGFRAKPDYTRFRLLTPVPGFPSCLSELRLRTDELATEEELWTGDDSADHAGWWCVRTDPFPCPASGCTFIAEFMTAAHLILVWQEQDDPNLLKQAGRARDDVVHVHDRRLGAIALCVGQELADERSTAMRRVLDLECVLHRPSGIRAAQPVARLPGGRAAPQAG